MGKGLEGDLHTATLPLIPVALVRPGIGVWTHYHLPVWKFRVGTPYAFNVVSRTLDAITAHTIEGAGVWYDLNACSNRRTEGRVPCWVLGQSRRKRISLAVDLI